MILRIRKSRTFKGMCLTLALSIFFEIVSPMQALALTGGPAQPEFSSFTPIGTSDMVDLSSGDMSYNIPLLDVGGYPLNLAYSGNVGMDDEASWVGLGWNLSVGQINRNVRGIPDDFKGDKIQYENYLKDNVTVGASFKFTPHITGIDLSEATSGLLDSTSLSAGLALTYNNYSGFAMKPSVGITLDLGNMASVGLNVESGPDGLCIAPNLSLHSKVKTKADQDRMLGTTVGTSFNSRQGLSALTLNVQKNMLSKQHKLKNGNTLGKDGRRGGPSLGSSIGFAEQLYTPTKRVGMETKSFTVNAALGTQLFGGEGQGQITAFGTIMKVKDSERNKELNAYGYNHTDLAATTGVLDFNREKDGNFSINTTNLPLTNYTYDIYSVQGQGVSGMYRPYRNQVGYVFDPYTADGSNSGSFGFEAGTGNAFHLGLDLEATDINSHSGLWQSDNYILSYLQENYGYNPNYEKVHYKNVGDLSVDRDFGMFNSAGNYNAVRVQYIGNDFDRKAVNELKKKINWEGNESIVPVGAAIKRTKRQLRNQAIQNITVAQLEEGVGYGPVARDFDLINANAQGHHVGEVQIIRNDGARYIYGLPAYNTKKREASFAVNGSANCNSGLVTYSPAQLGSPESLPHDKFLNRVTTPAYVHTHLLTSILSTDYQDLTGDGPSQDDLGSYTRFSYKKQNSNFKWRVPFSSNKANFNEGLKTEPEDDQGNYVYGEKELFYIDTIFTKTHLAIFYISDRHDAYGVDGEGGAEDHDQTSSVSQKLDKIELFSIEEFYDENGDENVNALPIKIVHFVYNYALCQGVPNNDLISNEGGKLTLKKVYFTYRDSKMGKYTGYTFDYDETDPDSNPDYNLKGYDTWGNFKPNSGNCANSAPVTALDFPYTGQDQTTQDTYAAAWLLRTIRLPSGGEITVEYESDDYSYVQDKPVHRMFFVKGAGLERTDYSGGFSMVDELYTGAPGNQHVEYLYIEVDDAESTTLSASEIYTKYLSGSDHLIQFRFFLNMTQQGGNGGSTDNSKFDYVSGYFKYDHSKMEELEVVSESGSKILVLPVEMVEKEGGVLGSFDVNPIAKAGWQFGRKYLSSHVYSNQPNGNTTDIEGIVADMIGNISNMVEIFSGPNGALENKNICRKFITHKSWVRLKESDGIKLGGGSRVKKVIMTDNWEEMVNSADYQTMSYGQEYKYGLPSGLSSGVAAYEPIGNKENPFVQPVFSTVKHLLAPNEENYIEKPFGESFFPSPVVTYSRVEVSNLQLGEAPSGLAGAQVKPLHRTGKVVTEFYTTKDYPTIVDQTILEADEDKNEVLANILNLYTRKHMTASQGYVVHLNDMNGKQKAQRVFAQGQSVPISGVDYIYDNYSTPSGYSASSAIDMNSGKLNNKVKVINPDGSIEMRTIGVEVDVVNDFRECETVTEIVGVNANLATFFVGIIPGIVPIPLPDYSKNEDRLRTVSTTKVINTFGLLKETIAYDAGSAVYTRNLAWDASTGEVLVTETIDEFNDRYYTLNYPAHWYYKGMAQASMNLGMAGTLSGSGGTYSMGNVSPYTSAHFLIEGDELFVNNGGNYVKGWVVDLQGNQFKLIDEDGDLLSVSNGSSFTVFRSGHRNLQSAGIMNVTLKHNPLKAANDSDLSAIAPSYLNFSLSGSHWKIINAGAVDYSDQWKVGCECGLDLIQGTYNPYRLNERGVWRTKSSRTYLAGRAYQEEVTPRSDGYFTAFSPMYKTTVGGNWVKDFTNWTFVAEVSKYSPYGFELENKDALERYSAAQYGYNHTFPMAVGANTEYRQIGYDGFEDYGFDGCPVDAHFNFQEVLSEDSEVTEDESHTGRHSLRVAASSTATLTKILSCETEEP